jgi:pimeloyl-ACP methyl ester carboxylesterase
VNVGMDRVSVDGGELEFACAGSGEAVVFIHGVGIADAGLPLAAEPALREHYRVIRYRRRGYAGSTAIQGPVSIAEHARDCQALLAALEVRQSHVVGHSYGTLVALQLAVAAPSVVSSLALFEPPWRFLVNPEQFVEVMRPSMDKYQAGDRMGAVDEFFSVVLGPDWRREISRTVPGGPEQADKDAATMFESDLVPGQQWRFGAQQAAAITQPVLLVSGAESNPEVITQVRDLIRAWLPQTEDEVMPEANHLLHLRRPADAAARLANFLKRHPIAA